MAVPDPICLFSGVASQGNRTVVSCFPKTGCILQDAGCLYSGNLMVTRS